MQQAIDDSHPWFWSFEIYYRASVLCLSGNFFEGIPIAWLFHLCFGLKEKMYLSLQAYSLVCKFLAGGFSWVFYAVLRVQFITPVHYSICWTLSTWIIESYASVINYIVHIHNLHFSVYSFAVKIHCVGTLHTRSYTENKLVCKYLFYTLNSFFLSNFTLFQIWLFWFLVLNISEQLSVSQTASFIFLWFIYIYWLTVESGSELSVLHLRRMEEN